MKFAVVTKPTRGGASRPVPTTERKQSMNLTKIKKFARFVIDAVLFAFATLVAFIFIMAWIIICTI